MAKPALATDFGSPRLAFVGALAVGLVVFNNIAHLIPGHGVLYVPLNLAIAGLLLVVARRLGVSWDELGLSRAAVPSGLRWGAGVAAVVGAGLALGVAIPPLHPLLDDARVAGIGGGVLAYRTLLRIPLGTAVLEEVAFRGVLFGTWSKLQGVVVGAVGSSVAFGLWHIRPTLVLIDKNEVAEAVWAQALLVALAVLLAAIAGLFFCLLRIRSGSLLAPLLGHAAINSLATLAAFISQRI